MIKNYFKIAWRNLLKYKVDSVISIGGLALGLACCILLMLSVRYEMTYDNFHDHGDRLFRVTESSSTEEGKIRHSLIHPYPLATALDSTYPEIKHTLRLQRGMLQLKRDNKFYYERALLAGPDFFTMFSFPLVAGDKSTVLSTPNSIVLSEHMAKRLWGDEQAMGKVVTIRQNNKQVDLQVTGIAEEVPGNSSIQFDIVVPFETTYLGEPQERVDRSRQSWYEGNSITWVMLHENSSAKTMENKLPHILQTHLGEFAESQNMTLGLQPLSEVYFSQEFSYSIADKTNIQYTIILGVVALIILIIAGINFMSLRLSRISGRNHEIGIRKVAGAGKQQLTFQMLGEIALTCSIALILGFMLAELLSPYYQQVIQKPIHSNILGDPMAWLLLLAMIPAITLVTGIYPAFIIATQKAFLLFNNRGSTARIPRFVKGLIVAQFGLSIMFLIVTFFMQRQMDYMLNRNLGFSPKNVVSIEFNVQDEQAEQRAKLFRQQANGLQGIQEVALTRGNYFRQLSTRGDMTGMRSVTDLEGFEGHMISQYIDEYYLQALDIKLLKGRGFSTERPSEIKDGVLVNQKFVDLVGWEQPVGQVIQDRRGSNEWPLHGKQVIGVVDDFYFQSLYNELQPLVIKHLDSDSYGSVGTILVEADSGNLSETVKLLNGLWEEMFPQQPFNYAYLDDLLARQYQSDEQWNNIMKAASAAAILLACFGLFGLAALAAQRRTKEIGIRKVMGASVQQIVGLLSKDFLKLVALGFLLAVPIAWYATNRWLQDFAYRIEIGPGVFLMAGGMALLIALATVSWQSIRAALANPVESLRSE